MRETALYAPLARFFTELGFEVKAEVKGCDLVAVRGDELIIVEMKQSMNLTLVLQGVDRKSLSDTVYLAIPAPKRVRAGRWRETIRLCGMLGLGLLTVRLRPSRVEVVCEPGPYQPRRNAKRKQSLLQEFLARTGDRNVGGSTRTRLITAYREEALRIAQYLAQHGPSAPKAIREATQLPGVPSKAQSILQKNFYGWFERVERGIYRLAPRGEAALQEFLESATGMESSTHKARARQRALDPDGPEES